MDDSKLAVAAGWCAPGVPRFLQNRALGIATSGWPSTLDDGDRSWLIAMLGPALEGRENDLLGSVDAAYGVVDESLAHFSAVAVGGDCLVAARDQSLRFVLGRAPVLMVEVRLVTSGTAVEPEVKPPVGTIALQRWTKVEEK